MAWFEIMPGYETQFRDWDDSARFLGWTGILVNHHRRRQVEEVSLEIEPDAQARNDFVALACASGSEGRFFLKKAFSVTWHERFLNAWHGFGWCATAVREAAILIAAKRAGLACPEVAAFGEHGRSAFVLLRGETELVELRALLPTIKADAERSRLAEALGHELARLHDAGFEHPDPFAKHVLVSDVGARHSCLAG